MLNEENYKQQNSKIKEYERRAVQNAKVLQNYNRQEQSSVESRLGQNQTGNFAESLYEGDCKRAKRHQLA